MKSLLPIYFVLLSSIFVTKGNIIGINDLKYDENTEITSLAVASDLNLIIPPTQIVNNLCKTLVKVPNTVFHLLTLQNNSYEIKELHVESKYCAINFKGIVSLLKWKDYQNIIRQELTSQATNQPIIFISNAISGSYKLISSEQIEKNVDQISTSYVIVEILPIGYQLKNIEYVQEKYDFELEKPEKIGTFIGKNMENFPTEMPGFYIPHMKETIDSSFSIFNGIHGVNVEVSNETVDIPNFKFEELSSMPISENASNMRLVNGIVIPPKTACNATIFVSYFQTVHDIQGIIITLYGQFIDQQLSMMERSQHFTAKIVVKSVKNVWQSIEKAKLQNFSERSVDVALSEAYTNEEPSTSDKNDGTVYPGFRTWFYIACCILFGVLFIALYDIVRTVVRERRLKRNG